MTSLNRLAMTATAHCLTGCAIGEVLGLVIGTALGWGNLPTIALAVALVRLAVDPLDGDRVLGLLDRPLDIHRRLLSCVSGCG